jgi:hypothetical protein
LAVIFSLFGRLMNKTEDSVSYLNFFI